MNRDWMNRASCRDHPPEWFFPEVNGPAQAKQIARAQAVCLNCPVIEECADYCQDTGCTFGIWAGEMIRKPVSATGIQMPDFPHGTEAGYKRHLRRGEAGCVSCREAANRACADRQRRLRMVRGRA